MDLPIPEVLEVYPYSLGGFLLDYTPHVFYGPYLGQVLLLCLVPNTHSCVPAAGKWSGCTCLAQAVVRLGPRI